MKVTLYSQASRQPDEQIFHQMIEVAAMHPISHYLPYKYFLNGLLTTQPKHKVSVPSGRQMPVEHLVRVRRCVAFSDVSGLQAQSKRCTVSSNMIYQLGNLCNLDHVSEWRSSAGTLFILNEPYVMLEHLEGELAKNSFSYIELPVSLSPYCGGWSDQTGAMPYSMSFLICKSDSNEELMTIGEKLIAAAVTAPLWNDPVGVKNV